MQLATASKRLPLRDGQELVSGPPSEHAVVPQGKDTVQTQASNGMSTAELCDPGQVSSLLWVGAGVLLWIQHAHPSGPVSFYASQAKPSFPPSHLSITSLPGR